VSAPGYSLVTLANGVRSVRSHAEAETFHPVIGPAAEAEALYVRQLRLRERLAAHAGEFVIWDVGLGAAANALTILRATRDLPCRLRLVSFDHTLEPLRFALQHAEELGYFGGYEDWVAELLVDGRVDRTQRDQSVLWDVWVGDFPTWLNASSPEVPAPHAILFDAFSPAKNPEMWTLPLFTSLFRRLDPTRPCAMPTYSRATLLRVTWLLAGFFVGVGHATGEKEETTLAANTLDLIDEPLDRKWLDRARRSTSAEPLHEAKYRQAPLSPETWERLRAHPQFR
jgi:queuine tRNA-ribosyltransferase